MNTYRDRSISQAREAQVASKAQGQSQRQQQSQPLNPAMDILAASSLRLPGLPRCAEGIRLLAVWKQDQTVRDISLAALFPVSVRRECGIGTRNESQAESASCIARSQWLMSETAISNQGRLDNSPASLVSASPLAKLLALILLLSA